MEKRKTSITDPHLVDNEKILFVSTASSSLSTSLERFVDSAGNIPRIVMSTMEVEATDLMYEVDSLMSRRKKKSVSDIREGLMDDSLMRLKGMTNDAENCLRLFMTWKRKHQGESNAPLKKQVDDEITKMKTS